MTETFMDILTRTAEELLAKRMHHKFELERIDKFLEVLREFGINAEVDEK